MLAVEPQGGGVEWESFGYGTSAKNATGLEEPFTIEAIKH